MQAGLAAPFQMSKMRMHKQTPHCQMSKMRMHKQTQERVSADFANVKVRLDAPWSVQPHRWILFEKH